MPRAKKTRYTHAREFGVVRPWLVVDTERHRVVSRHHDRSDAIGVAAALEITPLTEHPEPEDE